jgi:hypothetical protein
MAEQSKRVRDLLWRGRLQVGDEPGVYGDAQYAGLCLEFPIEVIPSSGEYQANGMVDVGVRASEVEVYKGFPGHPVELYGFSPDDNHPGTWKKVRLADGRLTTENGGVVVLPIRGCVPRYISLRVSSDSSTPPGLFDEIVVEELWLDSVTHYGYLGFRFHRSLHEDKPS